MKGQQCSWTDMRRIRKILLTEDSLPGEYGALRRCLGKAAFSSKRRVLEFMDAVSISRLKYVYPSHAIEIVRRKPREEWPQWATLCEKNKWTVMELRQQLLGIDDNVPPDGRIVATYHQDLNRALIAIRGVQEHAERLAATAVVTRSLHAEIVEALRQLEALMARFHAA